MRTKYYGIVGEMSKLKEAGINKLIKEYKEFVYNYKYASEEDPWKQQSQEPARRLMCYLRSKEMNQQEIDNAIVAMQTLAAQGYELPKDNLFDLMMSDLERGERYKKNYFHDHSFEFIQGQEWFENNIKKEIKEQYYQGLHLCKALFNALDLKYKDTVWKIIETYIPKDSLRYKYEMAMYHFKENEYKKAFSLLSEICNVTLEEGYRINKDYPYLFREMQNARLVLARMCLNGWGTAPNIEKANFLLQGDNLTGEAKYITGNIYEFGWGQVKDIHAAYSVYLDILKQGNFGKGIWNKPSYSDKKAFLAFRRVKKQLYPGQDMIKMFANIVEQDIGFEVLSLIKSNIIINWGDGFVENHQISQYSWVKLKHHYQGNGTFRIEIVSDEINTLMGLSITSPRQVVLRLDVSGCKALTHLICSNQGLQELNTKDLPFLRTLKIDHNKIITLNVKKNKNLTWLDCSHNPISRLKTMPFPALRKASFIRTKISKHSIARLNHVIYLNQRYISKIDPKDKEIETMLPTLYYYVQNSNWKEVRNCIMNIKLSDLVKNEKEYHNGYNKLIKMKPSKCHYKDAFLLIYGSFVPISGIHYFNDGSKDILSYSEEDWYLYYRPWEVCLATPVMDDGYMLPAFMCKEHSPSYITAMCLYNMLKFK